MSIRTSAQRPTIETVGLRDRQVVDARQAQSHQAMLVEFPVFVAVAAKPMAAIMPLVGETHGDSVLAKRPKLLDQPIIEFTRPFARQERLNGFAPLEKFRAVAPAAIGCIG